MRNLKIRHIKSNWVRLLVLACLGFPCYTYAVTAHVDSPYFKIVCHGLLIAFFACIIIAEVGLTKFTELMAVATAIALLTVLPQIIWIKGHTVIDSIRGNHSSSIVNGRIVDFDALILGYVKQLLVMLTVIPYSIFALNCFSISDITRYAATGSRKTTPFRRKCLAMVIAELQYLTSHFPPLIDVWREEHPQIILPRHRTGMHGVFRGLVFMPLWIREAAYSWVGVALMTMIKPLPMFYRQIQTLN